MRVLAVVALSVLSAPLMAQEMRFVGLPAAHQLERAHSLINDADESLTAVQAALERDAAVLAKLREARAMLEEDTQPMTVVNAVAVRVSEVMRMRPHGSIQRELELVQSTLDDFRRSSANIDLVVLTRELDAALNVASDVVVDDVRTMQPILASIIRMQDALQSRLSGLVQSQARSMEMTSRPAGRR